MGWEEKMEDAKRRHRPRLKDWSRDGFATTRAHEFEALADRFDIKDRVEPPEGLTEYLDVTRVHAQHLNRDEFVQKFEVTGTPLLISDVPTVEDWPAVRRWQLDRLLDSFYDCRFKCGEDDDGHSIRVSLKTFRHYISQNRDDSPLYIFDSSYDDHKIAKQLLEDYKVPSVFPTNPDQNERGDQRPVDLFSLVGESRRPPYRWVLVGPKRSGTCVHVDPLGTSAWNTVTVGRKLWVLFPPGTSKSLVKAKKVIKQGEDDESINYFVDLVPRLRKKHPDLDIYQFIQYPGDTVFIPGGWWHAVLNLDDTVAVTQNFCSETNFPVVWKKTRSGRKKMSVKWLRKLHESYPHLAQLAEELNEKDDFVMPSSSSSSSSSKKSSKYKEDRKAQERVSDDEPKTAHKVESDESPKHKKRSRQERDESSRNIKACADADRNEYEQIGEED